MRSEPSRPLGWKPEAKPKPQAPKLRSLRQQPPKRLPVEPLYTTREVAAALRIGLRTLYRWHTEGKIRSTRPPTRRGFGKGSAPNLRFPLSEVRRLAGQEDQ